MRPVRSTSVVLGAMLVLALAMTLTPSAQADDLSRRWQLGGSISWQSTQDSIRSNAAFALFDELGDDNIPNTGDEEFLFLDPRPDSLVERETSVDDDFRLDLLVAYGIKPWLSVQLDAAYFSTDLIQFDTFAALTRYGGEPGDLLTYDASCNCVIQERVMVQSQPFVPAEVTQIPITVSAVFRFWPEGVWNLYLTAGVGYVFVDIDETERFDELNRIVTRASMVTLSTQQIPLRPVDDSDEAAAALEILRELYVIETTLTQLPQPDAITLEADDSIQYTLGVGGNYFINSHWAMDFEIRYLLMEQDIKIDVSGYDQLNYRYRSPENLLGCGNRLLFPDELFPPDFDRFNRGIVDLCRPSNAFPFSDQVLVQGGTINLSSWVFRFGVRYVF